MYSFIEELYFGNVNPQKERFGHNSNYAQAMQRMAYNEEKLIEILGGEEKKLFLDYVNAWSEVLGESDTETFVEGFRTGAYFAFDTFVGTEDNYLSR